jgi:hypothetical protein
MNDFEVRIRVTLGRLEALLKELSTSYLRKEGWKRNALA